MLNFTLLDECVRMCLYENSSLGGATLAELLVLSGSKLGTSTHCWVGTVLS